MYHFVQAINGMCCVYRDRLKLVLQVWWIYYCTCLSRNLEHRLQPISVVSKDSSMRVRHLYLYGTLHSRRPWQKAKCARRSPRKTFEPLRKPKRESASLIRRQAGKKLLKSLQSFVCALNLQYLLYLLVVNKNWVTLGSYEFWHCLAI